MGISLDRGCISSLVITERISRQMYLQALVAQEGSTEKTLGFGGALGL